VRHEPSAHACQIFSGIGCARACSATFQKLDEIRFLSKSQCSRRRCTVALALVVRIFRRLSAALQGFNAVESQFNMTCRSRGTDA
jgi:hypothetical protein